jgi:hypothetical protein
VFFLPRPHNTTPLLRLLQPKVVAHISAACSDHTNITAIGAVKHTEHESCLTTVFVVDKLVPFYINPTEFVVRLRKAAGLTETNSNHTFLHYL